MSLERDPDSGEVIPDGVEGPFPNPMEEAMDYAEEARGHLIAQYRDKPRAIGTVEDLVGNAQLMENEMVKIPTFDDPALAGGVNLDVTGELVGQSRVLGDGTEASDIPYRDLIAQRIEYNKSICSIPQYISAVEAIVFPGAFRFLNKGGMAGGLEVEGFPSDTQVAKLETGPVPVAMGVGISRLWYNGTAFFGFQGDPRPGLDGFGLESDLTLGGHLGMLF